MNEEFLDALHQIEKEKDIPYEVLLETIEQALVHAYKKRFAITGDVRVLIRTSRTGFKVFCRKEVVEDIENSHTQISLEDARKIDPEAKLGSEIELEVTPEDFGRIAAQTAKQVVMQRIREAEQKQVFEEFKHRKGEVVTGQVQRTEGRCVIISLGKVDAMLPPEEQVAGEHYKHNDRLKVYVVE